jgi:pentatricopeptide repeat protein
MAAGYTLIADKNILLKNYLRKGNLVEAKNMFKKFKVG